MDKNLKYWLALSRLRGLERYDLSGVLLRFGGPEGIFREGRAGLEAFSAAFAETVCEFKDWGWVDKEIALIEKHGVRVLTLDDALYPRLLKHIYDPPCILYTKGSLYDYNLPAVAIVGTRHPSHYGLSMSETIARDLAAMGVVIVSGMARGCDMAAHKGALSSGGFTVAVLGTGINVPYPRENTKLHGEIMEKGLVVTEMPISTPPLPENFPRRNRIISGLSKGVLVIEAPVRSGSLMTARLALDYNREVMAIPGHANSPKSMGTNKLLKDGAIFVENAVDVMQALSFSFSIPEEKSGEEDTEHGVGLGGEERLVWEALEEGPAHIDSIMEHTGLSVARASTVLLDMELKGIIEQKPGKCFLRRI